jgi:hypothetical protein
MTSKALRQFTAGLLNPKGNLGDFRHAARTFVDDSFRLMPKHKFLFHVSFHINTNSLKSLNFKYQHQNEINVLVKSADLPKYTITSETLNQYNRKKVVQTKIDYQPITIKFHDDNLGVTRQLWENYFSYYYADPITSRVFSTYTRNAMLNSSFHKAPYGLDNNSSIPFFDKIVIYQMARRYWNSYTLVNPIITAWNHDSLDYSNNGPSEQTMTLAYEAVYYDNGRVSVNSPTGFATDHYDRTPSPISLGGGGTRSLFGAGGVLAGVENVFGAVSSGQAFSSPENFVATAIRAVNTYQNSKALSNTGINQELQNMTVRGLTAAGNQYVSGINNTRFPISDINQNNSTQASARNLGR